MILEKLKIVHHVKPQISEYYHKKNVFARMDTLMMEKIVFANHAINHGFLKNQII